MDSPRRSSGACTPRRRLYKAIQYDAELFEGPAPPAAPQVAKSKAELEDAIRSVQDFEESFKEVLLHRRGRKIAGDYALVSALYCEENCKLHFSVGHSLQLAYVCLPDGSCFRFTCLLVLKGPPSTMFTMKCPSWKIWY